MRAGLEKDFSMFRKSSKFHQMKKARPTMFSSGTKPQ